jgi:pimeloyl-ACP methyl ester carboxylesterase
MFEMASSWEIAVHEAGHALHNELKPNRDLSGQGYRTWGESFGDQVAMWTSLRDPGRVRSLLAETNGDLSTSNALSRLAEAFAALVGEGTGLRDAVHDKRVSDTSEGGPRPLRGAHGRGVQALPDGL